MNQLDNYRQQKWRVSTFFAGCSLFAFLFLSQSLLAQSYCVNLGVTDKNLELVAKVATPDNGLILVSQTGQYMRIDQYGVPVWSKGVFRHGYSSLIGIIALNNSTNFLILDDEGNRYEITPNGEIVGIKPFSETIGTNLHIRSIIQTSDFGFAMVGSIVPNGEANNSLYLVKLDANGDAVWSSYAGGVFDDVGYACVETPSQKLLVSGVTNSIGLGRKVLVSAFLPNGDLELSRSYDFEGTGDIGENIVLLPNGAMVVGIYHVLVLNQQGLPVYGSRLSGMLADDLLRTNNGDIYIAGTDPSLRPVDMTLLRLNNQGVIQNAIKIGSTDYSFASTKLTRLSSGAITVAASRPNTNPNIRKNMFIVSKLDNTGSSCCTAPHPITLEEKEVNTFSSTAFSSGTPLSVDLFYEEYPLTPYYVVECTSARLAVAEALPETLSPSDLIYPNPANDHLILELAETEKSATLVLFDQSGKRVLETTVQSSRQTIDISSLSAGFYTAQLSSFTGIRHYKLVVE